MPNLSIIDDICINNINIQKNSGIGISMDIGTTTVVLKYVDLENGDIKKTIAFRNPQCAYGNNVINRIDYDIKNPSVLHNKLIEEISKYITKDIKKMVVCGNTVMTHLFLNESVESLGHYPFEPIIKEKQTINSSMFFKDTDFPITTFPNIAGFVGGDIVSGLYANDMAKDDDYSLMIDLGTNGEMVFGNKDGLIATSCACGPAFEAVGITSGVPSIEGAIYSVSLKEKQYKTIGDTNPIGICGSGIISLISELKNNNQINKKGKFLEGKEYYLTNDIYIDNKSIQSFLLAKAAVAVGVKELIQDKELKRIYISGGFGRGIKAEDLVNLKMIPDVEVINKANSAISGAYQYLLENDDDKLIDIVNKTKAINLATLSNFDNEFIEALML